MEKLVKLLWEAMRSPEGVHLGLSDSWEVELLPANRTL